MSILAKANRDIARAEEIGSLLDERAAAELKSRVVPYSAYAEGGAAARTAVSEPTTQNATGSDAAELERLAELSPIEYEREREAAAEKLGIRVSALDKEVARRRPKEETEGKGHEVVFDEPEPWPSPVDGAAILDEVTSTLRRFVVMADDAAQAAALWIVFTWVHDAARISPILAITSPAMRCGKTTLIEVLMALVRRALSASNITAAALFRAVEKFKPTLLVDEADTFLRNSDELRGVLNSGHRRRTASVIRTVGDDYEPAPFRTWAPKVIALIGKLSSTLADRSINIELRRRGPGETVSRWRDESFPELRRKLARWAADNENALAEARPELPTGLHDRALDNWEPLFAIAEAAGGDWPTKAREAARTLNKEATDDSTATLLLGDIRDLFAKLKADRIASGNLCEHLADLDERPWGAWGRMQKPLTPRQLANQLKPFKIRPSQGRQGENNWRGYDWADFADAFARYLPSATTLQPAPDKALDDFLSATDSRSVADTKSPKPAPDGACSAVADGSIPSEHEAVEGEL